MWSQYEGFFCRGFFTPLSSTLFIHYICSCFILHFALLPCSSYLFFNIFFIILRIWLRIYYRLLLLKNSHLWIVFFFFPFFLYLVLFFSSWIRGCLLAIFAILVNGNAKGWVKTSRGLRQRDPPFPFLSFSPLQWMP